MLQEKCKVTLLLVVKAAVILIWNRQKSIRMASFCYKQYLITSNVTSYDIYKY